MMLHLVEKLFLPLLLNMKKIFTLLLLVAAQSLVANDSIPVTKVTHKFGGRIDVMIFSDSYNHVATRNGLQYIAPVAPSLNSKGEDVNFQNRLRMSASPSRFNYQMTATNVMGANLKGMIEVDFMGNTDANQNLIRMRHVYIDMKWDRRSLLIGQTSHLSMPDEAACNTVTYGGGYPFYPLNRPVQVQFHQKMGENYTLALAAAMFSGKTGDMQSYAMIPDFQARITSSHAKGLSWGAFAGFKVIKPRTLTADESLAKETLTSFNAGAFARMVFPAGYAIKLYGIWGQELSSLSVMGGYAPLLSDAGKQDYGYTSIAGVSALADFESPVSKKGWQWGIFGGMQQNLGSADEINPAKVSVTYPGMDNFWRLAPRVFYHYQKSLSFGLEYMASGAKWAESMDENYKPIDTHDATLNHRITFLARYKF